MYDIKDLAYDRKVIEVYPELAEMFHDLKEQYKSFVEITSDQVLRYIILTYHFDSPLVQSKAELMWRKKQAMLLAGVKPNDEGFFCEEAMKIIANQNPQAIDLKMRFVRSENNMDWVELSMLMEGYYDYVKVVGEESVSLGTKSSAEMLNHKLKAIENGKKLKSDIDTLSSKVFKGDVDLKNYVGSTIVKEERRYRISPEVKAEVDSKKKANG